MESSWNPALRPNSIMDFGPSQENQTAINNEEIVAGRSHTGGPEQHLDTMKDGLLAQGVFPTASERIPDASTLAPQNALGMDKSSRVEGEEDTEATINGSGLQLEGLENVSNQQHASGDEVGGSANADNIEGVISATPALMDVEPETIGTHVVGGPKDASEFNSEIERAFANEDQHVNDLDLTQPDRTNSFPDILELLSAQVKPPTTLPHSQATNILEGIEGADSTPLLDGSALPPVRSADWDSKFAGEGPDVFDEFANLSASTASLQSFGFPVLQDNEEARFEEGLSLLGSTEQTSTQKSTSLEPNRVDLDAKQNDHIINELKGSRGSVEESPTGRLARKPTAQVMSSLRDTASTSHGWLSNRGDDSPSQSDSDGNERGASDETTPAKAHAEHDTPLDQNHKAESGDLSELWRAALDEEELLETSETSVDPSNFFEDDGEGFLEEDDNTYDFPMSPAHQTAQPNDEMRGIERTSQQRNLLAGSYSPTAATAQQPTTASGYLPNRAHGAPSFPNSTSMPNGFHQYQSTTQLPLPSRPQLQASTQSFADKSKGGYTSPYDLPMDVTRPRKRAAIPSTHQNSGVQSSTGRPPPPRRSSMFSTMESPQASVQSPPELPGHGHPTQVAGYNPTSVKQTKQASDNPRFFEELPMSKPRPSSSMARPHPLASYPTPPPSSPQPSDVGRALLEHRPSTKSPATNFANQLLPPERLSLFGDPGPTQLGKHSAPVMNSRYSPAPSQSSSSQPPMSRYSSSSAAARPPSSHAMPHQPRTSSPLAQSSSLLHQRTPHGYGHNVAAGPVSGNHEISNIPETARASFASSEFDQTYNRTQTFAQQNHGDGVQQQDPVLSLPNRFAAIESHAKVDPSSDELLASQFRNDHRADTHTTSPPKRSQTQSPGVQRTRELPMISEPPLPRPSSVTNYAPMSSDHRLPRKRMVGQTPVRERPVAVDYIRPVDGREFDPLERWKGCPIICFGFGGTIVKTFPQHVPRYSAGQKNPMMKCGPGEVKIENGKASLLDASIATFPGPLKTKGKKKDVIDWLRQQEHEMTAGSRLDNVTADTLPDPAKCHEERILLCKIIRVLVEHDGIIEGKAAAEQAVRAILSPELEQGHAAPIPQPTFNAPLIGITQQAAPSHLSAMGGSQTLEEMRRMLLRGDREQAVWHAVDGRLWAHAMLLASTLEGTIMKQVSQEFVRQEIKTSGRNTESLAAMFQIFAGNWEESVDELVPPSARAGLQMVSKTAAAGPTKNALDGIDRWRETLTLILANRTTNDSEALVALGRMLASYGRTEAAHICYIFAKGHSIFGGPDDQQSSIALVGADHQRQPFDYGRDFNSILLTEVLDFARTILTSSSGSTGSPHLQSYRLYHAMTLAEYGSKTDAQAYCESISSTLKSTTKPSPYYHALLAGALDSLQDRLRQTPRDGAGSWISRPSIDKVSGSIWAKFNSYVAGDEDEAGSTAPGNAHDPAAGPFARVAGDSPTLSRTPSSGDLYSAIPSHVGRGMNASSANSRYTPGAGYTPPTSLDPQRPYSQDGFKQTRADALRPSSSLQSYAPRPAYSPAIIDAYSAPPQPSSYASYEPNDLPRLSTQAQNISGVPGEDSLYQLNKSHAPSEEQSLRARQTPDQDHGYRSSSYSPSAALTDSRQAHVASIQNQHPLGQTGGGLVPHVAPTDTSDLTSSGYPFPRAHEPLSSSSYEPLASSYEPPAPSYEPPASSYEPPTSSYEPPDYNTAPPDLGLTGVDEPSEDARINQNPRHEFTKDDNDEFELRAAALRQEEKARKDREADENFRKAAEADAQRDKAPKLNSKKSWFGGGWFGGAKDQTQENSASNAPIKVKLGEENSFYFDEQLKKWVNKKGGLPEAAAAPAPPPPKGPPSRTVSAAGGPPLGTGNVPPVPPIPRGLGAGTPPNRAVSGPALSSGLGSSQPSRTSSPAVNPLSAGDETATSSGPPSAPPSRPTTSQSGASNIDDLIGLPQARKGGTVRKGKKGRGYVDVMAKWLCCKITNAAGAETVKGLMTIRGGGLPPSWLSLIDCMYF